MNGSSIIFVFLIFLLAIVFIVGTLILLVGLLKKDKKNSTKEDYDVFFGKKEELLALGTSN